MKKVLIACVYPKERVPGQRFRFEQYLDFLSENGFEITFSNLMSEEELAIYYKKGHLFQKGIIVIKGLLKRFREVRSASKYDLVFIPRECFILGTSWFERWFAGKAKMIFDYDDAIWITTVFSENRWFRFLKNPKKTKEIIAKADLVFAGNQFLKDYAAPYNPNVVIVPTTIDTNHYTNNYGSIERPVCIGWSGSFSTTVHFETCVEALKVIKNKYGSRVSFKVIGDGNYRNAELGIVGDPWVEKTEVQDLRLIDIGIMPLPEIEWAKGKCGLKGLQYMALSIPTVMSPVGVNSEIIQDGINGFLAADTQEWIDKLSLLVESKELRMQMGARGRETVVEKYSIEAVKHSYLKYFRQITEG